MFTVVKQKLYEVDFLREPAYSDKTESNTRLYFTIFLLLCAAGGFTFFFVHSATNRATVQQTITSTPKSPILYKDYYKHYLDDLKSNNNLECDAKVGVYFYKIVYESNTNASLEDSFDDSLDTVYNGACATYNNSAVYYFACTEAAYGAYNLMYDTKVPVGAFLEEEELYNLYYDNAYDFAFQLYEAQFSAWQISNSLVEDLVARNLITTPDQNALFAYTSNLDNETLQIDFFYAAEDGSVGFFDLYTLNDELYFSNANLTQCTYDELQSYLDVFNFALNSTSAYFGVVLFILGIVYALVKKLQHRGEEKKEEGKSEVSLEVKEEIKEEIQMETKKDKSEDKKEEVKEEKKKEENEDGPESDDD